MFRKQNENFEGSSAQWSFRMRRSRKELLKMHNFWCCVALSAASAASGQSSSLRENIWAEIIASGGLMWTLSCSLSTNLMWCRQKSAHVQSVMFLLTQFISLDDFISSLIRRSFYSSSVVHIWQEAENLPHIKSKMTFSCWCSSSARSYFYPLSSHPLQATRPTEATALHSNQIHTKTHIYHRKAADFSGNMKLLIVSRRSHVWVSWQRRASCW